MFLLVKEEMTRKLEQSQWCMLPLEYLLNIRGPCEDSNLTKVPFRDEILHHIRNYLGHTWLID